jgi:A/G-specific adenine glycosylase
MAHETPTFIPDSLAVDLRRRLLRWYEEEHRPLPWRVKPSEYATVVSEFMLQQTQMAAVIPYFEQFTRQFPNFKKLAEASEQDVLRAWSGLGYYRRARLLKRVAEILTRSHRGHLPRDPEELAGLPGFGEYTVGAVGSIALGLPLPLVDGNVRRVVSRLFALEGDLTRGAGKKKLWAICAELVDPQRPGDYNQSLMDLGATVCQPREPLCLICPVFEHCRARAAGFPEAYPAPLARPAMKTVREVAVAFLRRGKVLVLQRGEDRAFSGMWELPRLDSRVVLADGDLTPNRVLFDLVRLRSGPATLLGQSESIFTHHRIHTELYRVGETGEQAVRRQRHLAHRWIAPSTLAKLPASRAQRRLFEMLARAVKAKPEANK